MRKIYYGIALTVCALALPSVSTASEALSCPEMMELNRTKLPELSIYSEMQSRECHSRLSDVLKARADTNEILSRAVYHQLLAGESFRDIPLWPDKHEDWVGDYEGYNYAAVFKPALNAADESWDKGFDGGLKHDFAVGWTITIAESDFEIVDYRNRTGRVTRLKTYMQLPALMLIFLILLEALIDRMGWLKGRRFFYRYKYR